MTVPQPTRSFWIPVALITLAGLALRVAAARGGLWLDEAWSAHFARETGTLLGVFVHVNHDNNHHLNTIWLQLVGETARPLLQRGLAILSGTAAIAVVAAIVKRWSLRAALVAAALFAVSPILITYGSEARGYAPMLLALLLCLGLVDRWLAAPERPVPARALALAALLGMLSQLSFAFGLVALTGWAATNLFLREGLRAALVGTLRLVGPAIAVATAFLILTLFIARTSPTGFQFGDFDAFTLAKFFDALGHVLASSFGLPLLPAAAALAALLLAGGKGLAANPRLPFYLLAILAFPLAVALLQLPNSGFPRYYLLCAFALLLLAAELVGRALTEGGWRRWLCALTLLAIVTGSLARDAEIVVNLRGDPSVALDTLAARAPGGAIVSIEQARSAAVLDVAARSRTYPLRIVASPCPAAPFLYLDRDGDMPFPDRPVHCGQGYRPIAGGTPTGITGGPWRLYAREQ